MNIYQLQTQYLQDAERLSDLDLDEQTLLDTLDGMAGDLEAKAQATVIVARHMRAESEAIRAASTTMMQRARQTEARAEALETRVFNMMLATGITKISCPYFGLSIKNNPASVDIFDELQVPQDYRREIPASYPPDKALIGKAIKDGFEVPGARLVQAQRLGIK
jgi:hypothetical protein